ncbi:MAG: preprotein translocase subunit SecA, partial [Bdellovibrionales bacterium]|nr:preprotein translocase subunit SecA [Bdellovibrionales bacterium]
YFRMYPTLAGMTGTAETEEVEFKKIYNLDVVVIPTNKPIARLDQEDVVYKSEIGKLNAMVEDIAERHKKGQPILVGTVSIEKSELISRHLKKRGITHNVLNAKHHEREAEIVSQAGRLNAITIATNMAGRGTDIKLGGNAEALASKETDGDESSQQYFDALKRFESECAREKEQVLELGGLFIMGTERNESRRIDNQLRGRSGRQGDPGESRFYLSLEDSLMRIFNGERIQKIMNTLNVPDDEPIVAGMVTRAIEGAQRKVEGHNFDIRKHLLDYDDVMNKQRNSVYGLRKQVLAGDSIDRLVLDFLGDVTSRILDNYVPEGSKPNQWDLDGLDVACAKQYGVKLDYGERAKLTFDGITDMVSKGVKTVFDFQKGHLGEHFEELQKIVLLETIDTRWKEHLLEIDRLKEGINLRAYAQKDPLIEYKKEAFATFERMMANIQSETIEKLLKVQLMDPRDIARLESERSSFEDSHFDYHGSEDETAQTGFSSSNSKMGFPSMNPQGPGPAELQYSGGGDSYDDGPKMNRAERRRLEKQKKKKLR